MAVREMEMSAQAESPANFGTTKHYTHKSLDEQG
jgi:hypothetical protein